jgi:hypothetical protein
MLFNVYVESFQTEQIKANLFAESDLSSSVIRRIEDFVKIGSNSRKNLAQLAFSYIDISIL